MITLTRHKSNICICLKILLLGMYLPTYHWKCYRTKKQMGKTQCRLIFYLLLYVTCFFYIYRFQVMYYLTYIEQALIT